MTRLLTGASHEVLVRGSSVEALRDILDMRPDCVITDVMMPVMDGIELTRELRRRPELALMKIKVLSAKTYDFDRRRAKKMGADGYITDNELYLPTDARHGSRYVERLVDFVSGSDVLITDTTYRDHEYLSKVDWGHYCVSQVADLAARAEVKPLHLFQHDPD